MVITKVDAARIQIDAAIEHFFKGEYVPAITLAGAAEDILAGLLKAEGQQSAFEFLHDWYQKTYQVDITKKEFSRKFANLGRNWLKHADDDVATKFEVSSRECIQMFMRALPSYYKLTKSHTGVMDKLFHYIEENMSKFEDLFS